MSEYERTATIRTPPQAVYDFVSKVENLPRFMPTTDSAQSLSGGEHVRVAGAVKGHSYSADGYFHAEPNAQRLEWKADEGYYEGWLQARVPSVGAPPPRSRFILHCRVMRLAQVHSNGQPASKSSVASLMPSPQSKALSKPPDSLWKAPCTLEAVTLPSSLKRKPPLRAIIPARCRCCGVQIRRHRRLINQHRRVI